MQDNRQLGRWRQADAQMCKSDGPLRLSEFSVWCVQFQRDESGRQHLDALFGSRRRMFDR